MPAGSASSSFGDDVIQYWIPRLVADGGDANDALAVRAKVTGWSDWPAAWTAIADGHRKVAAERLAAGHTVSAGEALVRASICYHFGQVVAFHVPAEKAELQARKVAAYREAAQLLVPPADRLEVPFRGITLPGYLRLPPGKAGPHGCAVLVPGLDSTKEDFNTVAEMCVRRGLAAFAFDGPGQGEVRAAALLAEGYEACFASVFEAMARRPEIDARRIGLVGRSLGGFYILRAAAAEPRVAAAVVFGGAYDLSDWPNMPPLIRAGFQYATGAASEDAARARMGSATLDDCIGRVRCPVLVVHGRRDSIFRWQQATRIAEALGSHATLMMDDDGVHCCHNHALQYRTAIADWLSVRLA